MFRFLHDTIPFDFTANKYHFRVWWSLRTSDKVLYQDLQDTMYTFWYPVPTYRDVLWDASAMLGSNLLVISTFSPPCSLPAAAPPPPPPPQRCATLPHSDIPIKTQTTSKSAGSTRLGLCQTYFIFNDGPSIQFICAFSSHPYLYFVYVHNT